MTVPQGVPTLLRDDGAVVYLNGTEVARSNLPAGAITATTFATTAVGGADESTFYPFTVSASGLVSGTNVLAVEVHQSDRTSTDISFDLELTGTPVGSATSTPPAAAPSVTATATMTAQRTSSPTPSNTATPIPCTALRGNSGRCK